MKDEQRFSREKRYSKIITLDESSFLKLNKIANNTGHTSINHFINECIKKDFFITYKTAPAPNQLSRLYEVLLIYRNNFNIIANMIDESNPKLMAEIELLVVRINQMLKDL